MADNTYHLYAYTPSLAAAVILTILFALATALHAYQLIKTRAWYLIPIGIGRLCTPTSPPYLPRNAPFANQKLAVEWIGYIGRAMSSQQGGDWTIGPYIMQSLLLLKAPLFFAASIYMSLARIAQGIGAEDRCIISPRWLTRIFVTGDVLSLLVVFGGERAKLPPRRCVRPSSWVDIVIADIFLRRRYTGEGKCQRCSSGRKYHRRWSHTAAHFLQPLYRCGSEFRSCNAFAPNRSICTTRSGQLAQTSEGAVCN